MGTDTVVTPTALTPGIVAYTDSYKGGYGPTWSSWGPSEAAHLSIASNERAAFGVEGNFSTHFIRDAVERRQDAADTRAEIRSMYARFDHVCNSLSNLQAQFAAAESARLKSDLDAARMELLVNKILASKDSTPVK